MSWKDTKNHTQPTPRVLAGDGPVTVDKDPSKFVLEVCYGGVPDLQAFPEVHAQFIRLQCRISSVNLSLVVWDREPGIGGGSKEDSSSVGGERSAPKTAGVTLLF